MKVRLAKLALAGLFVTVVSLAMAGTAAAGSVETHYLSSTFGDGELSLEERSGIVYDKEAEKVYVADTSHGRIATFGPEGEPLGAVATLAEPTFLAIDNTSGDLYVGEGREGIVKLDPSGAPVVGWGTLGRMGGFGEIAGITVDPTGNLFVLGTDSELHELNSAGTQTNQCTQPYKIALDNGGHPYERALNPSGIAADGEGAIYLSYQQPFGQYRIVLNTAAKLTSACEKLEEVVGGYGGGLTTSVDESDNSVYVASSSIEHVTPEGEPIGGGSLNHDFGSPREGLNRPGQLTVRSDDETLYVEDLGENDIAVFTPATIQPPEVEVLPPTEVTATSAHLRVRINPGAPEGDPAAWNVFGSFRCIDLTAEEANPQSFVCSNEEIQVPAGSEPVVVEGTARDLQPASEYALSVKVENVARAEASPPVLHFKTGAIAPGISESFATEASESGATVTALINPHGAETGYEVEYVTRSQFEASEFAEARQTPEQHIPSGVRGVPVSVALSGLGPSTPYVARVFATNTIEGSVEQVFSEPIAFATREPTLPPPSGCSNEEFRTGLGALLPDCRAYEQATPANKNGGGPEAVPGVLQAAEGPAGITFFSQAGIPGGEGAQDYPSFISSRGAGVWSTQGLLPPATLGRRATYLGLTPGGRYAITEAEAYDPVSEEFGTALFERDLGSSEITTIVPYDRECAAECFTLAGASADGSRVFFESEASLTRGRTGEETPAGQPNLFFWERGSERISLVDLGEAGEPLPAGGFAGPYNWSAERLAEGGAADGLYTQALNAVSRDGSEVFYTEAGGEEGEGHCQLYVRLGLGGASPHSVKVSAYQEGKEGPEYPAAFLEATADGRYVFFKSRAELTSDAYAGEGTESLYRYDVDSGELVNLTSEARTKFQDGPGVLGMLGASESGESAYFVATSALTTAPGPGGQTAAAGEPNVFRWEAGARRPLSFVATLRSGLSGGGDATDWSPGNGEFLRPKSARVSADGDVVAFISRQALTGAENRAKQCGSSGELGACPEFFRYSATGESLDCVSCDPTGVQPLAGAAMGSLTIQAEDYPRFATPFLSHNLSTDGKRFFFQTSDPLVASDVNAKSGCRFGQEEKSSCMDVYEWEAPGAGSCPQASVASPDDGCLYLISTGQSGEASYLADADREGRNVYIMTSSQLVPTDGDHLYDIYDAREGGGFASQHQEPAVPCGSRQACQGPQRSLETPTSSGTSTFAGPGNPKVSTACGKGFVKKHGKCVKKHERQRKHHKKHHRKGKKGKKKHRAAARGKQRAGHERGGRK